MSESEQSENIRLLLVEEGEALLDVVAAHLARVCPEWQTVIVSSREEAVSCLRQRPFHLLLLNLTSADRGVAWLEEVGRMEPPPARVILADTALRERVVSSPPVAHRFLPKPCRLDVLEETLRGVLKIREGMRSRPGVERLCCEMEVLPVLPALYLELVDELDSPRGSLVRAASIAARDPALAARLLQLANSPLFLSGAPVVSVERAAVKLGATILRTVALASQLFEQLPLPGFSLDAFWMRAQRVAAMAVRVVRAEGGSAEQQQIAGSAGLLRGFGQLLLLANLGEEYFSLLRQAEESGISLVRLEEERWGASHPQLGALLLALWGVPWPVVEGVDGHWQEREPSPVAVAVQIAEALVTESGGGPAIEGSLGSLLPDVVPERLNALRELLKEVV